MDAIEVPLDRAYRLLNHGPVILVSSTDGLSRNVCTVAWACPCSKNPPTFAIALGKRHRTYKNIMKTGYFGLNVPTVDLLDLVWFCGSRSGDKIDKVHEGNIPIRLGTAYDKLPLVDSCAAWLECKMVPGAEAGDHGIIVAQVVAAACRPGVLCDDNTWNTNDFPTLHHVGGKRFVVGKDQVVVGA